MKRIDLNVANGKLVCLLLQAHGVAKLFYDVTHYCSLGGEAVVARVPFAEYESWRHPDTCQACGEKIPSLRSLDARLVCVLDGGEIELVA
jgi:hypothetical protein